MAAIYGKTCALRCEVHRLADDRNFVEKPCGSCGLLWPLSEKGLCRQCSEGKMVMLAKQRDVKDFLAANMTERPWTSYDRTTPALRALGDRERPDFFWDCGAYVVILEVDEDQHASRREECDCSRMVNIAQAECRPTYFLRYNPDSYKTSSGRQAPRARRLDLLLRCLREVLERRPDAGPVAVKRLFFDGFTLDGAGVWAPIEQL